MEIQAKIPGNWRKGEKMKNVTGYFAPGAGGCAQPQPTAPTKPSACPIPRRSTVSNPAASGCRCKTPQGVSTQCKLPSGETLDEWALWRRDHPAKS